MNFMQLGFTIAALTLFLAGCTQYTDISVKDGKARISSTAFYQLVNNVEECDVQSDGTFTNCRTVK